MFEGKYFPEFISGSGYVTTRAAALCLYEKALETPLFHLEDVFLTGFLAEKCSIHRLNSDKFHFDYTYFMDIDESHILWHYMNSSAVEKMHRLFTYKDLLQENDRLKAQLFGNITLSET